MERDEIRLHYSGFIMLQSYGIVIVDTGVFNLVVLDEQDSHEERGLQILCFSVSVHLEITRIVRILAGHAICSISTNGRCLAGMRQITRSGLCALPCASI